MMAALAATAMTLGELVGAAAGAHAGTLVNDLILDSRDVRAGAAFVALQGGREHGLGHAADALARGAAAVLYDPAERPAPADARLAARAVAVPDLAARLGELARKLYLPPQGGLALAGVTGTNGKTTVTWLAAQALTALGRRCGYTGTLGYGVPPRLTGHALTTPDCFTLHRELRALGLGETAERAVLEVSSHALVQNRIAGLAFDTAAFTNLSREHLDAHGSLDAYGAAKAKLFAVDGLRYAVLNVGDPFARQLLAGLSARVEPIRVCVLPAAAGGTAPHADLAAAVHSHGLDGLELEIEAGGDRARLRSPLVGRFNAENLVVALGILRAWDVPLADACDALGRCAAPPGRFEVLGDGPRVIVDYAHTPDGLERALEALATLAHGERWCVFGCGGERDPGKRAAMGRIAAAGAEHLIVTDDNPRNEDPAQIVRGILAGVGGHPDARVEHDRGAAIRAAVQAAAPHDVVLIAGKGHETTQRIKDSVRPFSDRDAALAALVARSSHGGRR